MSNRIIEVCFIIIFILLCSRLFGLRDVVGFMHSGVSATTVSEGNCVFATMFFTLEKQVDTGFHLFLCSTSPSSQVFAFTILCC